MPQAQPFDVASLVPSQRDFLQAVRTGRKGLALVPIVAVEEAAREALRMAESGVTAIAMRERGSAMAEGAQAVHVPVLSLRLVASADDALASRAFRADAILLDPGLPEAESDNVAAHARSTRMVALPVARTRAEAERASARGAKALVVTAANPKAIAEIAAASSRVLLIALPTTPLGDDVQSLRGVVDAAIVDVDVYGQTGFERLVSELNP